ncbi:MAG: flavin reductase [Treponema sp.]|nr:flavin reductase [Treponema sp.]
MGLLKMAVHYSGDGDSEFVPIDLKKAYRMIKPVAMVATKGKKHYDLTPYVWIMPLDFEPVTRVVFSSDPDHQTVANIRRTGEFAVCFPSEGKEPFIHLCGTVSNPEADKYGLFKIDADSAEKVDARIPKKSVSGWIEFRLIRIVAEGSVVLVMGEAVAAYGRPDIFSWAN